MELSDDELSVLYDALEDVGDKIHHYPDEFSNEDKESYSSLMSKTYAECKKRGFWWAR